VRSYERSDLVYKAMVLRGYGQLTQSLDDFQVRAADIAGLFAILLVAAGFVIAEIL